MELRKAKSTEHERREDLRTRIVLLTVFVDDLKSQYSQCKEKVKNFQKQLTESKNVLAALKAERGKPEASLVAEIELLLDNFNISRASYHGGDYNGVCCRRLANNCNTIAEESKIIVLAKKDARCDEATVNKKVDEIEQLLGLLDAAFALTLILSILIQTRKKGHEGN
jgi:hypothetical protein